MSSPLSTPQQISPAAARPVARRAKLGEVVARYAGLDLAVCVAGKSAALHIETTGGVHVFTLPLESFLRAARGPVDHNRRPFPAPSAPVCLGCDNPGCAACVASVAALREAAEIPAARRRTCNRRASGTGVPAYRRVLEVLRIDPFQNASKLCASAGVKYSSFGNWLSNEHPGGVRALRAQALARGPKLKPSGAIL